MEILSSDSEDCELYTRTAEHIEKKMKILAKNRAEFARSLSLIPDDQVKGFGEVCDNGGEISSLKVDVGSVDVFKAKQSEEDLRLNQPKTRKSTRTKVQAKSLNKKVTKVRHSKKRRRPTLNNDSASTTSCNGDTLPIIVLDDDTGFPTSSSPINFKSRMKGKETCNVNSPEIVFDQSIQDFEDDDYEMMVKISIDWQGFKDKGSSLKHFDLGRYQKFEKVFEELANLEGLPTNRIVLMRNYETIRPRDTPASLNLTYYGHLVGSVSSKEVNHDLPKPSDLEFDNKTPPENELKVKLVFETQKHILLTIFKHQKMKVLYTKCSEEINCPENKIKIYFDGELVNPTDTVTDLEIEGGEVFDVKLI